MAASPGSLPVFLHPGLYLLDHKLQRHCNWLGQSGLLPSRRLAEDFHEGFADLGRKRRVRDIEETLIEIPMHVVAAEILGHHDLAVCSLTTLAGAGFKMSRNLPAHSVSAWRFSSRY